jgi:hypothetical protein
MAIEEKPNQHNSPVQLRSGAQMATSNVKIPHQGRFVNCYVIKASPWRVDNIPKVHLEIRRDGGPYVVLRMDPSAAMAIAHHIVAMVDHHCGTHYANCIPDGDNM